MSQRPSRRLTQLFAGLALLLVTGFSIQQASANDFCYSTFWPSDGRVVELDTCEYTNGSSGFIVLTNVSNQVLDVCWTLEFNDGSTEKGCHSGLRPGVESRSSCYRCNMKTGGRVRDVIWRKVDRR
ncbi:MAG: hypothetical protein V2I38_08990 [Alcanivoracaceae bacterium]|jgi:hypothetical protein|nr:hypothetical protein [Alcanivoracaceae bacterium]